jgi:hypothetical protein
MPRDDDLSLSSRPDIVLPAVPQQAPAEVEQHSLEITTLHRSTIHTYV